MDTALWTAQVLWGVFFSLTGFGKVLCYTKGRALNELIEIRGARENNLKDVLLRIPKRQITIFTGVSGSGESSIVFDTIATEAQRQL
jgi:ABC-type proline/glycine betaine transport system ATPase subunit